MGASNLKYENLLLENGQALRCIRAGDPNIGLFAWSSSEKNQMFRLNRGGRRSVATAIGKMLLQLPHQNPRLSLNTPGPCE